MRKKSRDNRDRSGNQNLRQIGAFWHLVSIGLAEASGRQVKISPIQPALFAIAACADNDYFRRRTPGKGP
jgi:hypothetical protein